MKKVINILGILFGLFVIVLGISVGVSGKKISYEEPAYWWDFYDSTNDDYYEGGAETVEKVGEAVINANNSNWIVFNKEKYDVLKNLAVFCGGVLIIIGVCIELKYLRCIAIDRENSRKDKNNGMTNNYGNIQG